MSRRMLLLGLNQTILFALSMVVIAGLTGVVGSGHNSGLFSNPALAILAGIVIVVMATAPRSDHRGCGRPHRPDEAPPGCSGEAAAACRIARRDSAIVGTIVVAKAIGERDFPEAAQVRQRVQ